MPSNRRLKSDDVDGFMIAVWDSIVDLESDFGVKLVCAFGTKDKRGHLMFSARAYDVSEGASELPVASAEVVWPTHYATSVHALLYGLLVRLWRDLDRWQLESIELASSPPTDEAAKNG